MVAQTFGTKGDTHSMNGTLKLGSVRGIVISVHYTWLIIFGLLTYSLAAVVFPTWYSDWSTGQYWLFGAIASLLLFAAVLAHELGHSLVALRKGIPVQSITLFIFGGVANIGKESETAGDEFQIAIAGPAVSLIIGGVSIGLYALIGRFNEQVGAILQYLAFANIILAVFNLIPGFPLDGGRVLRAILWGIVNNVERATRIASTVGVVVGYLFMIGGIAYIIGGVLISGIWLIAIGWFLQNAAQQSYQQLVMQRSFEGVQAAMLMNPEPVVVEPYLTIDELVDRVVLARNVRGAPVMDGDRLVGIITLTDIKDVPRSDWSRLTVADRMTPADKLIVVQPQTPLDDVLQAMSARDIHQVPVIADGRLVGMLNRSGIIQFLQLQRELDASPEEVARAVRTRNRESRPVP